MGGGERVCAYVEGGAWSTEMNQKKKNWKRSHHFQFNLFLPHCPPDHREYSPNQIYDLSHLNSVDFLKRWELVGGGREAEEDRRRER